MGIDEYRIAYAINEKEGEVILLSVARKKAYKV